MFAIHESLRPFSRENDHHRSELNPEKNTNFLPFVSRSALTTRRPGLHAHRLLRLVTTQASDTCQRMPPPAVTAILKDLREKDQRQHDDFGGARREAARGADPHRVPRARRVHGQEAEEKPCGRVLGPPAQDAEGRRARECRAGDRHLQRRGRNCAEGRTSSARRRRRARTRRATISSSRQPPDRTISCDIVRYRI